MNTLKELLDSSGSTLLLLKDWVSKAVNNVEMLPVDIQVASDTLLKLQVSTKSMLGIVVYHTGGILVDGGWLRILGSGSSRLSRSITSWNNLGVDGETSRIESLLLVADDVVGGFFAINGGALEGRIGDVFYFAPDTLEWEDLGLSYSEFVHWVCTGDLAKFYETFRWSSWVEDVKGLDGDKSFLVYPYLWAAGDSIEYRLRKVVPVDELWYCYQDYKNILG